jgi:hypothetical protein
LRSIIRDGDEAQLAYWRTWLSWAGFTCDRDSTGLPALIEAHGRIVRKMRERGPK